MSYNTGSGSSDQTGAFNQNLSSTQQQQQTQGQQGVQTQYHQTQALPAGLSEQSLQELSTLYGVSQVEMAKMLAQATGGQTVTPSGADRQSAANINRNYLQGLESRSAGGDVLSPAARAQLDREYGTARQLGMRDIDVSSTNDANRRGLSVTDSPVANAKALAQAELQARLGAGQARDALQYGQQEADRATAFDQYQKQLQAQAFQNRLALIGTAPASYGLQSSLFNQRLAQGVGAAQGTTNNILQGSGVNTNTGVQSGTSQGNFSGAQTGYGLSGRDVGGLFSGAGALAQGAAKLGWLGGGSSGSGGGGSYNYDQDIANMYGGGGDYGGFNSDTGI